MIKILLIGISFIFFFIACDNTLDHSHDGVCINLQNDGEDSIIYQCYKNYSESDCIWQENVFAGTDLENSGGAYSWYYMTCEEFCSQTSHICNTNTDTP